jgi:hypothetical protein
MRQTLAELSHSVPFSGKSGGQLQTVLGTPNAELPEELQMVERAV